MGDLATFAWGYVGGLAAFVAVFVLPEALYVVEHGGYRKPFTLLRVAWLVVVLVIYVSFAGLVAMVVGGAEEATEAIMYGMGVEALTKGITTAAAAVARTKITV